MTDRTVSVKLQARVEGYLAGIRTAQKATRDFAADSVGQAQKHGHAFDTLGKGMLVTGAVIGAGAGLAVKAFMDFDKQISAVSAATKANRQELDQLRATALKAGADTKYSATEAAAGEEALAKAGVSVRDIVHGGLSGALNLAAAGNMSVADSADLAATAMTQFHLKGTAVSHIADLLAAGAGKAQGEVSDLAFAFKYAGTPAAALGVSLEETVGTLALFAKNGILGEQAGTMFRGTLASLTAATGPAAATMKQYGINVFDAQGKFIGMSGVAEVLHTQLGHLTQAQREQALATIFGREAMNGAQVLYEAGAAGVNKWTGEVDASGYAADVAARKMDNLSGDLEQLRGSIETTLIKEGSGANGALRDLTQGATLAVNAVGGLPGPLQQTGLYLAGASSAALLAGGSALFLTKKVAELKVATETLNISMTGWTARAAMISGITAGVAVSYFSLAHAIREAHDAEHQHAATLESDMVQFAKTGKASTDLLNTMSAFKGTNTKQEYEQRLHNIKQITNQMHSADEAMANLVKDGRGDEAAKVFDALTISTRDSGMTLEDFNKLLPKYQQALGAAGGAAKSATADTSQWGTAETRAGWAAQQAAAQYDKASEALHKLDQAHQSSLGSEIAFRQSIDDVSASLKHNGTSLDLHKAKGRANAGTILQSAQAALSYRDSLVEQGKSTKTADARLADMRGELVKTLTQHHMNAVKAQAYVAVLLGTPKNVDTSVHLHGAAAAMTKLQRMRAAMDAINGTVVPLGVLAPPGGPAGATGGLYARRKFRYGAGGEVSGLVIGPGTGTSDDVSAPWLSNGEYVEPTASVDYYGLSFMNSVRTRRFPKGLARGYRDGGQVGYRRGGHVTDPIAPLAGSSSLIALLRIPGADDVNRAWDDQRSAVKQYQEQLRELSKVEHDRHANHHDRVQAETDLAAARKALSAATATATRTERAFRSGVSLSAYGGKLAGGNRASAGFQGNLERLAGRGFGDLAQEIAAIGGAAGADLARKASHASSGELRKLTGQVRTQSRQKLLGEHLDTALALISTLAHARHPLSLGELVDTLHTDAQTLVLLADLVGPTLRKMPTARAYLREASAGVPGFRHGGLVGGAAGTDANLIAATRGEFVVSPEGTAAYGPDRLAAISAMRFAPGAGGGYASGGAGGASGGGGRQVTVNMPGTVIRESVDVDQMWARWDFHERAATLGSGV